MNHLHEQLRDGAETLGIALDDAQCTALVEYLALLARWNRKFNLTAIRNPTAMVAGHLLDSLAIAHLVRPGRCADVGTGAGLPGIPLAITRPADEFVLIDSNGKKTRFVEEARRALGLGNVTIRQCRVEDYRPGAGFDTVMCRAFAPLPRMLRQTGHLVAADGIVLAQKGRFPDEEMTELPAGWACDVTRLSVPGLDRERHAVTLRRCETASA